jgi:hypothetical protein
VRTARAGAGAVAVAVTTLALALALGACGGDDDEPTAGAKGAPRCTPGAAAPTAVDIAPKWSAGDAREVSISKTSEESGQDPSESSATADLRVLAAGAKGSRLEWKSADPVLPEDQLPDDAEQRLKDSADGFTIVYGTDAAGAYTAKRNVAEIRDQLKHVLDRLEEDPADAESVARSRAVILSDTFIQTSVVKEIAVLHGAYGLKLQEGRPERVSQQIANPFGGAALTAKGTAELVEARNENGCAIVEVDVKPARAELARSIADTFGGTSGDVPAAARKAGLSVHNTTRYTYDPGTGWLARADVTQTVTISGRSRSDITVITTRG